MSDYTSFAILTNQIDPNEIQMEPYNKFGTHPSEGDFLVCFEYDKKFESLRNILGLPLGELPTMPQKLFTAKQFIELGMGSYEGDENDVLSVNSLYWLNSTTVEWTGTDEEYDRFKNEENAPSFYREVENGDFETMYADLNKVAEIKEVKCIVFRYMFEGDKSGYWTNWLGGDNTFHTDFDCVFFAKNAEMHMDYSRLSTQSDFEFGEHLVNQAKSFANEHPDDVTLIFG